jgi:hypothetical protein
MSDNELGQVLDLFETHLRRAVVDAGDAGSAGSTRQGCQLVRLDARSGAGLCLLKPARQAKAFAAPPRFRHPARHGVALAGGPYLHDRAVRALGIVPFGPRPAFHRSLRLALRHYERGRDVVNGIIVVEGTSRKPSIALA